MSHTLCVFHVSVNTGMGFFVAVENVAIQLPTIILGIVSDPDTVQFNLTYTGSTKVFSRLIHLSVPLVTLTLSTTNANHKQ